MAATTLQRDGNEYRATTPGGTKIEIFGVWPSGGWMVVRADGEPIRTNGEDGMHSPTLREVRELSDRGWYDDKPIGKQIMEWAEAHYNEGADVIVECMTEEECEAEFRTLAGAARFVELKNEQRQNVIAQM